MANRNRRIRYGMLRLGNIGQTAACPAFEHASQNSVLVALMSNDPQTLEVLEKRQPMTLGAYARHHCLQVAQDIEKPPVRKPRTIHAPSPTR